MNEDEIAQVASQMDQDGRVRRVRDAAAELQAAVQAMQDAGDDPALLLAAMQAQGVEVPPLANVLLGS